jgi:hypothetical protein
MSPDIDECSDTFPSLQKQEQFHFVHKMYETISYGSCWLTLYNVVTMNVGISANCVLRNKPNLPTTSLLMTSRLRKLTQKNNAIVISLNKRAETVTEKLFPKTSLPCTRVNSFCKLCSGWHDQGGGGSENCNPCNVNDKLRNEYVSPRNDRKLRASALFGV